MSAPKRFDTVTIVGIAVAIAIFLFGWSQTAKQQATRAAQQQALAAAQAQTATNSTGTVVPSTTTTTITSTTGAATAGPGEKTDPKVPAVTPEAPEGPDIVVTGDHLLAVFASRGGTLKSVILPGVDEDPLKKDKKGLTILTDIEPGKRAFGIPTFVFGLSGEQTVYENKTSLDTLVWELKDSGSFEDNRVVTATREINGLKLEKKFSVNKHSRVMRFDFTVTNTTAADGKCSYWLNGPQGVLMDGPPQDPKGGSQSKIMIQAEIAGRDASGDKAAAEPDVLQVYASATKADDDKGRSVSRAENLWGAVKNRFHMAALISLNAPQLIKIVANPIQFTGGTTDQRLLEANIGLVGYRASFDLPKGGAQSDPYALYAGPADDRHLDLAEAKLKTPAPYYLRDAIQFCDIFGWRWPRVDWLARQMMALFLFLHKFLGSFGLAVVFMTVIIKLLLHPLQRNMMVSMSKMQKLQPELTRIKKKYENQTGMEAKQRMNAEMQNIMSEAGANPLSGCLPMFIQIPVFSALYGIFNHAFDMRGAQFLWINDLSQPDKLAALPFWPHQVNLLPILYILLSFLQTRLMPQPQTKSDDPQQEMNRKMMMFMPVMISLMFYNMPAGLILYFTSSALWGMLESWYIRNFVVKKDPKPAVLGTTAVVAK